MLAVWFLLTAALAAPPTPSVDRIDYGSPSAALALPPSIGRRADIEGVARQIGGVTFEDKVAGIGAWMNAHLKV